jgi:hypothetical protein
VKTQVNCTEAEFHEHVENYDGLCMACGQWTEGGVEPDAQGYDCPSCDVPAVIGAEQALFAKAPLFTINIVEE